MTTADILKNAKCAKILAASLTEETRNELLFKIATAVLQQEQQILQANANDVSASRQALGEVMTDRLMLNSQRVKAMAQSIKELANLKCNLNQETVVNHHANGLLMKKVVVPMGVVAIIYESRPNVTADAAALCIKSGNVCVLRGGKEAFATNNAIVNAIHTALKQMNLSTSLVSLIQDTTRQSATDLMNARGFVDLLIPRGGAGLISACVENAKVPCIETGTGICHIYVDKDANLEIASEILYNAKTSRPSVCNAAEVCLVHQDIANNFLPIAAKKLAEKNVELRLCERAIKIIDGKKANLHDFNTEFLDYILGIKIIDDLNDAIEHINEHSTGHSEAIITQNSEAAQAFCAQIDSAAVYVNASTRFTDGGEFGLGCEMGISTQKLGARGPMGLNELTAYKYVIIGNGQIR